MKSDQFGLIHCLMFSGPTAGPRSVGLKNHRGNIGSSGMVKIAGIRSALSGGASDRCHHSSVPRQPPARAG